MSTELFLDFLGIRMDSQKAEELGLEFTINLVTPDNGEKFAVELNNATLTNIEGHLANDPDLTISINRTDLEQTMMGSKTIEAQIIDGAAKVEGDTDILGKLASVLVDFELVVAQVAAPCVDLGFLGVVAQLHFFVAPSLL